MFGGFHERLPSKRRSIERVSEALSLPLSEYIRRFQCPAWHTAHSKFNILMNIDCSL